MPLVFIHGVDTRDGKLYRASRRAKRDLFDQHLRRATFAGRPLDPVCIGDDVSFPYWGDLGASFRLGMASLPRDEEDGEFLGASDDQDVQDAALEPALATWADVLPGSMSDQDGLVLLAQKSFEHAVKVLNDVVIRTATEDEAGAFVAASAKYAHAHSTPPEWVAWMQSDGQFIDRLVTEVTALADGEETLGAFTTIGNAVHRAATRLKNGARRAAAATVNKTATAASTYAVARWRAGINAVAGRFTGDVFHYLAGREQDGKPAGIAAIVATSFERASAAGGPLVVVGHSLGGVISFDVLSYFRTDIHVDLFVSVGSQVSHFDEMGLLRSSDPKSAAPAPKPSNIHRWINVFDPADILSYACKRVFHGVEDLRYESNTHLLHAHSAYFEDWEFYAQLRKRIDG